MLIRADARHIPLKDRSVNCIVTSPPYWGLRDYGTPGQLGLELMPEQYVATMVAVFGEVWRVLRDDGTVWLNLGDSYCSTAPGTMGDPLRREGILKGVSEETAEARRKFRPETPPGLKPKDLCGIPWRVALALRADGWYLRSDIIWAKPNPMPESVRDRPTRSHEYIFLLSKSQTYYYDADAIREPSVTPWSSAEGFNAEGQARRGGAVGHTNGRGYHPSQMQNGRNKRSVWTVATQPYSGSHFATFPEKLIEPCILAGCPRGGIVLDPFVGSGTTVRVAERLNRRGIGCDLTYQDLAVKRLRNIQRELIAVTG